ncbi:MAG: helix-turn-helix transcriptional regulator [Burkholderiales bacterium]|nr:helix-turn-helix transcriptional regulator [Burkholderiales bacterium]
MEAARIAAGFETIRAFSATLGVSEARYRRWESGEVQCPYEILVAIAEKTGRTTDFLLRNVVDAAHLARPPIRHRAG